MGANDNLGTYFGKDGGRYKTQWDKNAADTKYEQNAKQIEQLNRSNDIAKKQADELKRANDIQQKLYEEMKESREKQSRAYLSEENIKRCYEESVQRDDICLSVGLEPKLIEDLRSIETRFDWNEYLYKDGFHGRMILLDVGCIDVHKKIFEKIANKKSYYHVFMFLLICGIFGTFMAILAEQKSLTMMLIVISVIFLVPTIFAKRSYNNSIKELDKLKKFFENYMNAVNNVFERLESYRNENYDREIDEVLASVLGIGSAKKTRVEALDNSNVKNHDEVSEKYNYAIANILDDYDKQIKNMVDELRKDFMM